MVAFLSPAWIAELDGAGVAVDPDVSFRLDQVVTGTPDGDVCYRLILADGRLRVGAPTHPQGATDPPGATDLTGVSDPPGGADGPADATITLSSATAVDLATGRRDGSDAFDAGLVRFRGDLARLQAATAALAAVAEGLALLRGRTTFASGAA